MFKKFLLLLLTCTTFLAANAQTASTAVTDSTKMAKRIALSVYPLLKAGEGSGVLPVPVVTEKPDPDIDYKLLFDFVVKNPDSLAGELNHGLVEIVRRLNLHAASGIPSKRLFPVIVVHSAAINAVKTNESYRKKFNINNPNIELIQQLQQLGARFIVCGQTMEINDLTKNDLLPGMGISVSAQNMLSFYQLKGYVFFKIL